MTEEQMLVALAVRLKSAGLIDELELPTPDSRELCWRSNEWHGYWNRFRFDADGAVIETGAGC